MKELHELLYYEAGYLGKPDKEFEAMKYVATRYAMGMLWADVRPRFVNMSGTPDGSKSTWRACMEFNGYAIQRT